MDEEVDTPDETTEAEQEATDEPDEASAEDDLDEEVDTPDETSEAEQEATDEPDETATKDDLDDETDTPDESSETDQDKKNPEDDDPTIDNTEKKNNDDSGETGDASTHPREQDINPQLNDTDAPDEETKETQEDDSDNLDETSDNTSDAPSTEVNGSDSEVSEESKSDLEDESDRSKDIDTDAPNDTPKDVSDDSNETNESTEDQSDVSDMEDNDDVSKEDETSEDDLENKKKDDGTEGNSGDSGDASTHPREEDIYPNKEKVETSEEDEESDDASDNGKQTDAPTDASENNGKPEGKLDEDESSDAANEQTSEKDEVKDQPKQETDTQDVNKADETSEDDLEKKKKDDGTEGDSGDSGDASTRPREEDIHPNKENVEVSDEKDETKNEDSDNLNDKNIDNKSDISNEETNESKADRVNEASEKETNDSDVEKQAEKKQVEQNTEDNSDGDVNNPDSQKNLDNDSNENKETNNAEKNDINNKESETNLENKNDNAQVDNPNKSAQDAVDGSADKVNETSELDEKNNEQESVDKKQAKKKANNSDTGDDSGDDGDIQVTPEYKDIHPEKQKSVEKDKDTQDPKDLGEIQESEAEKKKELEDQKEKEDEEDKDPDKDKKSDAKYEDLDESIEKSKANSVEEVSKEQEAEDTRQNQIERNLESKDSQKETQVEKIPNKEASEDSKKPEDNVDQAKEKENVEKKNVSGKSKDINTPKSTDKKASSKLEKEKNLGNDKQAKDSKFKTPENNVEKNKKSLGKAKETKKSSDVDNVKETERGQKEVPSAEQKNKEVSEVDNDVPRLLLPGPKETPNHRNFERINELRAANKRDIKEKIATAVKAPFEILQNILHGQRKSSNRFQNKRRYRDKREIKASETNINDLRAKIQRLNDFKNENWDKLSEKEKNEIETTIGNLTSVIGKDLDLKEMPKLEIYRANDDAVYGAYDSKNNIIYLNTTHLTDGMETIDTLAHEMRHAWQNNSTSEKAEKFKSDLEHPKDPAINYEAYREQASEQDAREYATQFCNQTKDNSSKLEEKNYDSSEVQPIYHTKVNELDEKLDYKIGIPGFNRIELNNFNEVIYQEFNEHRIHDKTWKNWKAWNKLEYTIDSNVFKNVDVKNEIQVKKAVQTAIDARIYAFNKLKADKNAALYLKDKNIINDANAVNLDEIKQNILIYKDKNAFLDPKRADRAFKEMDQEQYIIGNLDDPDGYQSFNFHNVTFPAVVLTVKWDPAEIAPEGLSRQKIYSLVNYPDLPEVFHREGSPAGNNLTGDDNATFRTKAIPYYPNPFSQHDYRRKDIESYKKIIDTINNLKGKDLTKETSILNSIKNKLNPKLRDLNEKDVANINNNYNNFQEKVKKENVGCDFTYGLGGKVAPLTQVDKKKYCGGASQFNPPISVQYLLDLGWLSEE